ncbi:hypothetical protein J4E89_005211 [Alternaria sp. Ai002NY15]|nr:hypothetical protein J4E89_005211 [Alternaria sp. Ai002NY15]
MRPDKAEYSLLLISWCGPMLLLDEILWLLGVYKLIATLYEADGADGPWSTFNLAVGDPVQPFRCIPGTSSAVVILPTKSDWCNATCAEQTAIFDGNISATWLNAGLFNLPEINQYISGYSVSVSAISISNASSVWTPRSDPASSSADFEIDSTVPQLWLPDDACALFEKAFGLIWDDSLKLYLVNDTTRGRLLAEDPVVQFTLVSGEKSVNYTFPYSAFNLRLTFPFVNSTTYYFPLKRASASARNMLGRTFLQETYVTVDYERLNFSLNQAYPDGGAAQIIPISSPSEETPAPAPPPSPPSNKSKGLSTAAYAGIGVGAGILALLAFCLIIAWKKRLGPFRHKTAPEKDHYIKSELHGDHKPWVEAMEKERAELDAASGTQEAANRETSELETVENARELKGSGEVGVAEVQGSILIHELPGHHDDIRVADEGTRSSS